MKATLTQDSKNSMTATFYYDGACPLCTREIAHWRRLLAEDRKLDARPSLILHDISGGDLGLLSKFGVGLDGALARAHAIDEAGMLHTGIPSFVVAWSKLPRWHLLASFFRRVPFAVSVAEVAYGAWARARPLLGKRAGAGAVPPAEAGSSCRYIPGEGRENGAACSVAARTPTASDTPKLAARKRINK